MKSINRRWYIPCRANGTERVGGLGPGGTEGLPGWREEPELEKTEPRGFIYTTSMELGTESERPSLLWFWGPSSIMVVHVDPLTRGRANFWHGRAGRKSSGQRTDTTLAVRAWRGWGGKRRATQ